MFRTDADETKMLVEKLLDENEQRAMNLFRLILSSFAPFAFSDGKEFIIMQTCETTMFSSTQTRTERKKRLKF